MKRCKLCGGSCESLGGGRYQCDCCGNVFSDDDFINVKEKAEIEAAKVKAAEEVKVKAYIEQARAQAAIEDARARQEEARARKFAANGADIFEKCKDGVLEITCYGKQGGWSGSGYLISKKGYAVTNAHVAADDDGSPCKNITVKVAGSSVKADVIALADNKAGNGNGVDLALIKLINMPYGAKALPLGNFDNVRTGEQIFVIGNSLGMGTCITSGIVSDRNRNGLLMYDCATNPGNSGGPVFNAKGEIIGTHVAGQLTDGGSKAQGMNKAIPVSLVKLLIQKSGIII